MTNCLIVKCDGCGDDLSARGLYYIRAICLGVHYSTPQSSWNYCQSCWELMKAALEFAKEPDLGEE